MATTLGIRLTLMFIIKVIHLRLVFKSLNLSNLAPLGIAHWRLNLVWLLHLCAIWLMVLINYFGGFLLWREHDYLSRLILMQVLIPLCDCCYLAQP